MNNTKVTDLFNSFSRLTEADLTFIRSMVKSIRNSFKGQPGAGLATGLLVDTALTRYLSKTLSEHKIYHSNEADAICSDIVYSLKTICSATGSDLALDWSKNPETSSVYRERFTCPIVICILETSRWWSNLPQYNEVVYSGIYFIDHNFCKNIGLTRNNKSNAIIPKKCVYTLLKHAEKSKLFIKFPNAAPCSFDILQAFKVY